MVLTSAGARTVLRTVVLMRVDRAGGRRPPDNIIHAAPRFLGVRPGQFVVVQQQSAVQSDWWMGQVVVCQAEADKARGNVLLQITDVDDGAMRWVHADQVIHVVHALDGLSD